MKTPLLPWMALFHESVCTPSLLNHDSIASARGIDAAAASCCHPILHTQLVVGSPVVSDVLAVQLPPGPQPAEGHGTHISDAYVVNSGRKSFQFETWYNAKPASHLN